MYQIKLHASLAVEAERLWDRGVIMGFWSWTTWVYILTLPLTNSVTLKQIT